MSLALIQTTRIRAALRSILRVANGREPSDKEVRARASAYLNQPKPRGLGISDPSPVTEPLFRADDYGPRGPDSLLGGADGRDISRGWASVREDLDTADESLTEGERRVAQARAHVRALAARMSSDTDALIGASEGLQTQLQELFYGGAAGATASGRGRRVWDVPAGDSPLYPQTTAILLSTNIAAIPTLTAAGQDSGSLASLKATTSIPAFTSVDAKSFVEQPFAGSKAWVFLSDASLGISTDKPLSALEITSAPGTVLTGIRDSTGAAVTFQTVADGTVLWLVPSTPLTKSFTILFTGTGSVTSLRGHSFTCAAAADIVWGPFQSLGTESSPKAFATSLESIRKAVPTSGSLDVYVSPDSADGPWTLLPPPGTALALAPSGISETDLPASRSRPDTLSAGFYLFPLSQADGLVGSEFSAGAEQAQAEAYQFAWESSGEAAHQVTQSDWVQPQGTPKRVAVGAGPLFQGNDPVAGQSQGDYFTQGTCLSRYVDDNGADLTMIVLKDADGISVVQAGFNYRLSFSVYTDRPTQLSDIPIGIFNPNAPAGALAGSYALPLLLELNGTQIYQTSSFFTDYRELSGVPANYGLNPGQYTAGRTSRSYQSTGAPWPPHCGRVSLALKAGWNTIRVSFYVPSGMAPALPGASNTALNTVLGPSAGIVFGPALFADPNSRYESSGILRMRGWPEPWTQLSEFDLRFNTPLGRTQVWAWSVDPNTSGTTGLLINHDPNVGETGYPTLDGQITGQPRNHRLSYLPPADPTGAKSSKFWVRAHLASSDPLASPLFNGLRFSLN